MKQIRLNFLPFALPDLDGTELEEIRDSLETGWITTGPKTKQFEQEFAAAVGARYGVAVNSCTAAMHLGLEAVGLQSGEAVIVPTYTFAATAEVVRYFGAIPILVDVDPKTLNISPENVLKAIEKHNKENPQTTIRAIMPVHVGGLPAEMDRIYEIAEKYGLAIIEDAAHAFPTRYRGRMIGSQPEIVRDSSVVCFSFYATKTITTGEGGMLCTDNEEWAERCRVMSLHGISKDAWKRYTAEGSWYYEIVAPGYKYNMTDIAAAMGLAQLRKAERMWQRRQKIARMYNQAFVEYDALQLPADNPMHQHAWHLYMLRLNTEALKINRSQFIEELKKRNIGASVHFIPLHIHPYYRDNYGYQPEDLPVAFREYQREISLPIYSKMSDQDVEDVVEAVIDVVREFRR